MQISDAGLKALMAREGVRLKAYQDVRGIWTIGVGHTSAAGHPSVFQGLTITQAEAESIFAADVRKYAAGVTEAIKWPATQCQYDAMVSLCYNIGVGGFTGSTVVHKFNLGNIQGAADAFRMWEKPSVLASRRESERKQFLGAI